MGDNDSRGGVQVEVQGARRRDMKNRPITINDKKKNAKSGTLYSVYLNYRSMQVLD